MSAETGHQHTDRCYWDCFEAGWVCRPAAQTVNAEFEASVAGVEPQPAPEVVGHVALAGR